MAYGSAHAFEFRYQPESTFGTIVDTTWADGIVVEAINVNWDGDKRGVIANENYRQRPFATRAMVQALAVGELGFEYYLRGRATAVADDARATITSPDFPAAQWMQNAWGGIRLGYRTVCSGGSATQPQVEAGDGAQYAAGDWGFFYDTGTDATRGYLRKIESISVDTFTLWAGHDLPFTPAASDVIGAVIQAYPHRSRIVNQAHASHLTHSFYMAGELADDVRQAAGCKLNLTGIEGIAAGEAGKLVFSVLAADIDKEGLTATAYETPISNAPVVTSTGDDTLVYISAVGAALAAVEAQTVSINPGIRSQPVPCVGGLNGRSGYTIDQGGADETTIDIVVDYTDDWAVGFLAETRYQILIQVGTTAGSAYGFFFANCELMEDPGRGTETDLSTSRLKFRALESAISTAATGDDLEKVRAKMEILWTCALS